MVWGVLGFVILQRLSELFWSYRNTRRMLKEGGREYFPGHYRLIVILHASWLTAMLYEAASSPDPAFNQFFLGLFVLLTAARYWILFALGRYFTTRIISLPSWPLVERGPYRWLRHPNYCVVLAEIFCVPMIFGWVGIALPWGAANALLLWYRIQREEEALAPRRI